MGYPFFGGVDHYVVLNRELFRGEGSSFNVVSYKALVFVVVKGCAHPYLKSLYGLEIKSVMESGLPDPRKLYISVQDDPIQRRGFRFTLFVVLEPFLLTLPCASPEHTQGVIVRWRREVAWLLAPVS